MYMSTSDAYSKLTKEPLYKGALQISPYKMLCKPLSKLPVVYDWLANFLHKGSFAEHPLWEGAS